MYIERKFENSKYSYLVECPRCNATRWVRNAKAGRCATCAGKEGYTLPTTPRSDARKSGDGYITKQGYHLMFKEGRYIPAQRIPFPNIPEDWVVHHVDGDKLHNDIGNLLPCSKSKHREIHGQLERLSYFLVQSGLVEFSDETYTFSTRMKEFIRANSVNSGKTVSIDIDGNPEPSPAMGRCNDYPAREYSQVAGSAEHPTS